MGWKYKTPAERKAAMKAYQAKYRALRKSGKWTRKTQIHSPRIAAKYKTEPVPVEQVTPQTEPLVVPPKFVRTVLTPEERKARDKEKQRIYWKGYYTRVLKARRDAKLTPEQREAREHRRALAESRSITGVIREITERVADMTGVTPDEQTARLLETGGMDFLMRAIAPRIAKRTYPRDQVIRIAVAATLLFLDRDNAVLEWKPSCGRPSKAKSEMV